MKWHCSVAVGSLVSCAIGSLTGWSRPAGPACFGFAAFLVLYSLLVFMGRDR